MTGRQSENTRIFVEKIPKKTPNNKQTPASVNKYSKNPPANRTTKRTKEIADNARHLFTSNPKVSFSGTKRIKCKMSIINFNSEDWRRSIAEQSEKLVVQPRTPVRCDITRHYTDQSIRYTSEVSDKVFQIGEKRKDNKGKLKTDQWTACRGMSPSMSNGLTISCFSRMLITPAN